MGAADGEVKDLVLLPNDDAPANRYNLVIVSEGYLSSQLGLFDKHVNAVIKRLKSTEPFQSMPDALNVFRLRVASKESGADEGSTQVATYFDACFAASPPQLLQVSDGLVITTVQSAFQQKYGVALAVHKIVVLVNTSTDGGSGGPASGIAVSAIGADDGVTFERTVLHELGHAFGLGDEYWDPNQYLMCDLIQDPTEATPTWPNRSDTYKRDDLPAPWKGLVNTDIMPTVSSDGSDIPTSTVGAFPLDDSDYYVPQWACTMQTCSDPFCAVCSEYIREKLSTLST